MLCTNSGHNYSSSGYLFLFFCSIFSYNSPFSSLCVWEVHANNLMQFKYLTTSLKYGTSWSMFLWSSTDIIASWKTNGWINETVKKWSNTNRLGILLLGVGLCLTWYTSHLTKNWKLDESFAPTSPLFSQVDFFYRIFRLFALRKAWFTRITQPDQS